MSRNFPIDIATLNSAISSYLIHRLNKAQGESYSPIPWLKLFTLIRENRVESCFNELRSINDIENLRLCFKMVEKRRDILLLRENSILQSYSKIQEIFQDRNLFPICFKGFGLSLEKLIPSRVRLYTDIDLIVDKSRIKEYFEILKSFGYTTGFHSSKIDPIFVLKSIGSLNFYNIKLGHNIDLHTTPFWPYFPQVLKYDELILGAQQVKFKDQLTIQLPSLTHHALILLSEGTKDLWFRIDRLLDFWICYSALKENELHYFNQKISTYKLHNFLYLAKSLLNHILEFNNYEMNTEPNLLQFPLNIELQISKQWAHPIRGGAPEEPFRTKAHLRLVGTTYAKIIYLVNRARLPTQNDLSRIPYLSKIPSIFILLRPARKVFNIARNFANSFP